MLETSALWRIISCRPPTDVAHVQTLPVLMNVNSEILGWFNTITLCHYCLCV